MITSRTPSPPTPPVTSAPSPSPSLPSRDNSTPSSRPSSSALLNDRDRDRCGLHAYEEICQIGSGTFGRVAKIRRRSDNETLVWKELFYGNMSEKEKQQLVSEVNILRELNHPHVVRYFDRIIDREKKKIYIVMEWCEGGDLNSIIKTKMKDGSYCAEEFIWKCIIEIGTALQECHKRTTGTILHRDLKLANIFLDSQSKFKLGDFGLARILETDKDYASTHVGTPFYMSPEQVREMQYNDKSDIWSLGCLIYELAALQPPFTATNHLALAVKIQSGHFPRIPSHYSDELDQTIRLCLQLDPNKRPKIDQLISFVRSVTSTFYIKTNSELNKYKLKYDKLIDDNRKKEENYDKREKEIKEKEREMERKEREIMRRERELELLQLSIQTAMSSNAAAVASSLNSSPSLRDLAGPPALYRGTSVPNSARGTSMSPYIDSYTGPSSGSSTPSSLSLPPSLPLPSSTSTVTSTATVSTVTSTRYGNMISPPPRLMNGGVEKESSGKGRELNSGRYEKERERDRIIQDRVDKLNSNEKDYLNNAFPMHHRRVSSNLPNLPTPNYNKENQTNYFR